MVCTLLVSIGAGCFVSGFLGLVFVCFFNGLVGIFIGVGLVFLFSLKSLFLVAVDMNVLNMLVKKRLKQLVKILSNILCWMYIFLIGEGNTYKLEKEHSRGMGQSS